MFTFPTINFVVEFRVYVGLVRAKPRHLLEVNRDTENIEYYKQNVISPMDFVRIQSNS